MAEQFDMGFNADLHTNSLDTQTSVVADITGGAIASVVDIGTSLWNSLPLTPEASTADILRRVNGNALRVYEEHPDAVQAASFIGGMFVPMGLAVKGMNAMRNGVKGAHWFSSEYRAAEVAKAGKLFETAGKESAAYRDTVRNMYTKSAVNMAIDTVAMEAMLVGMYNAHPYMEDYLEDPVKNFGISLALGGVIGGAATHIADRFALRAMTGEVSKQVFDETIGTLQAIKSDMTNTRVLQTHSLNIKSLDNIIEERKALGKTPMDDLASAMATTEKQNLTVRQFELFQEMSSAEIKAFPIEEQKRLMGLVAETPEMLGVENIRFLTEKDVIAEGLVKKPNFALSTEPSLVATQSSKGPIPARSAEAVFFPELGLYGTKQDAIHYAGASALRMTIDQLADRLPKNFHKIPNLDSSLELIAKSSAEAQGEYIGAIKRFATMDLDDLKKVNVSETDGPTLTGLYLRMMSDPEAAKMMVASSDRTGIYKKVLTKRTEELIAQGKLPAQGPDASYQAAISKIDKSLKGKVVEEALTGIKKIDRALSVWMGGKKSEIGSWATAHRESLLGRYADSELVENFDLLYNSAPSKTLRAKFAELADDEGNVYLYRGWRTDKIIGQDPVDSFATHPAKSAQFVSGSGSNKLYKVHVDDIIVGFEDIGSGKVNTEILVRAGARPHEATLDKAGNILFKQGQAKAASTKIISETVTEQMVEEGVKKIGVEDIKNILLAQKQDAIDTLLANGMPLESIAVKTNTNLDLIKAWSLVKQQADTTFSGLLGPQESIVNSFGIKGLEDAAAALDPAKRPLVLAGNIKKNPYIAGRVALDNKTLNDMNELITAATMASSKSTAAVAMGDFFHGNSGVREALAIMRSQLGAVNPANAGSAFWSSFDHFARSMKEVGPLASMIGKQVQRLANQLHDKVVKPISSAMNTVAKDEVAMIEFATFKEVNAGLKDWRGIDKDGYLVQKGKGIDMDTGKEFPTLQRVQVEGKDYQIKTPSVRKLLDEIQAESHELRNLANTVRKLQGLPDINDIGFWMPAVNPVNKFVAYVHDTATDTTKFILRNNKTEYDQAVNEYKQYLKDSGQTGIEVYTKDEQKFWSYHNSRMDTVRMEAADAALKKKGANALAIPNVSLDMFSEIAGGYQHYISAHMRSLADLNMSDITDSLARMSAINTAAVKSQPFDVVKKIVTKQSDPAAVVRNTLLGDLNLGEYAGWQSANKSFETILSYSSSIMGRVWDNTIAPISRTFIGTKKAVDMAKLKKENYEALNKELTSKGIVTFKAFDDELAANMGLKRIEDHPDTSKKIIYASNALAATIALRFGEIAQPLVNAVSLPILTYLSLAEKLPAAFMGAQLKTAQVSPVQIMYEGARAMNSSAFKALNKKWEEYGYFSALVSEMSDIARASRQFERGAIARVEDALDSNLVKAMSWTADKAESLTRRAAMNIGAVLAKRMYPELDDVGITIFARDFMDKAIGNFHAAQRPVFFQGTLGVALGLFQTYSLTLGQSIYRHLELKNYKALGKAALLQSSLFGTQSLPGFNAVSNMIGDHFSDDNVDLVTGTYRATGKAAADFILYGLPSNLGPTISTRGDSDPRLPLVNDIVAVNFFKQTIAALGEVKRGLDADFPDMGRSLAQAVSLQSMSRPLARMAELPYGYSITRQGNTVQTPEEVWTTTGIISRVLGTRPLEEQKLRDADHMNRFYGAADRENRQQLMETIRTSIRNGTFSEEKKAEAARVYLENNGSPRGFQAAINTALAKTEIPGGSVFEEKLKPNNPLNYMIDNLD